MFSRFTRLSNAYFWYFASLGLTIPFFGIYLDFLDFNSREIGEILAVVAATKIFGPTLWAIAADRTGKPLPIIQRGALLALVCYSLLFFVTSYWWVVIALASFSLFWNAILPQLEAVTLASIKRSAKLYGRIRLWGSIGFIVIAMLSGELIDKFSPSAFVPIGGAIMLMLWISTLYQKPPHHVTQPIDSDAPIIQKLVTPGFLLFFIAGILLQVSFGPYYSFFGLYVLQLDYPSIAVGSFIVVGVIAEILIFIFAGRLFKQFSVKSILVTSLLLTAVRWWLTASLAENTLMLVLAQVLHAASFGLYHSACMQYLHKHFSKHQQNRGQAIYISGVYGVGGALGAYFSGITWQNGEGAELTFVIAAACALIASLLLLALPKQEAAQKNTG